MRKKFKNPLKTFDKAVSVGYNYVAMMRHSAHFGHGLMSEIAAVKLADAADNSGGQVRTIRAVRQKSWKSKKKLFLIARKMTRTTKLLQNAIGG